MPARFEQFYRWRKNDALTHDALNRRWQDIDLRVAGLEELKIAWQLALAEVEDRVLERSELVIAGLRDKLIAITELEWLTARSTTEHTLVEGESFAFAIEAGDRELFSPGSWAIVTRSGSPGDYAVVRTLGYDRVLGQWDIEVASVTGDPGPHADWEAAAIAGSTLAQVAMLVEGKAARDEAVGAAADAEADRATVASDKAIVAADKATVAADKAIVASDKTAAQTAKTQAEAARDAAIAAAASVNGAALAAADAALDARLDVLEGQTLNTRVNALETGALTRGQVVGLAGINTFGF